jgi:hypothetical protein
MQHSLRRQRVQYCLLLVLMQHRMLVGGAALFALTAAAGAALFAISSAARIADATAVLLVHHF